MPASPIPREIHARIGDAPSHTTYADQWGEHGYVLIDDVVHEYAIDRKEGYDELVSSWSVAAFRERDLDAPVRRWLEAVAPEAASPDAG